MKVARRMTAWSVIGLLAVGACATPQEPVPPAPATGTQAAVELASNAAILRVSDVTWEQLNPARGDASPRAATLWGDRNAEVPTGFLVRFIDGFSSPPHIHNVTYRGVVIERLAHNDDANAEPMWMPPGSFWTQPQGEGHITAAKGDTMAFIEIDRGPYLVKPLEEAFTTDERPVNVHASNIVWLDAAALSAFVHASKSRVAFLWGDTTGDEPGGLFHEIPAGETSITAGPARGSFRAVVVGGRITHESEAGLGPGSTLSADGPVRVTCDGPSDCVLYVRFGPQTPKQGPS